MEWFKWFIYKQLLAVVGEPGRQINIANRQTDDPADNYQWVFCSTIGELNGCKPLIEKVAQKGQLVLITDRDCYQEAYLLHFPTAIIVQLTGQNEEVHALLEVLPPANMIVCEIPITPNDAPCRLSYGFLRAVKKAGVPLFAVNGWLYEYAPSCRQDKIERVLFTKDYLRLFDKLMVQTDEVHQKLLSAGAHQAQLHVTGNMKFDAVSDIDVQFKDAISEQLIKRYNSSEGSVFVAGCVAEDWEYQLLVDAFVEVLAETPDAKLILAPRHPEKQSQLDIINSILEAAKLSFSFKSRLTTLPDNVEQVLVLDTFGELRSFYSAANIAYMGRNHNILEPLAFGSPVVILSGWESSYPSYPVYQLAKQHDLFYELSDQSKLGKTLCQLQFEDLEAKQHEIKRKLDSLAQALNSNLSLLGW